jgi:hypothetical protein
MNAETIASNKFQEGIRYFDWTGTVHKLRPSGRSACGKVAKLPTRRNEAISFWKEAPVHPSFQCRCCFKSETNIRRHD